VWHGFASPFDFPSKEYTALLAMSLITLASKMPEVSSAEGSDHPKLPAHLLDEIFDNETKTTLLGLGFQNCQATTSLPCPPPDTDRLEDFLNLVGSSAFVPSSKTYLTQYAVKELAGGRPLCFMVIVLPVIEQAMRFLFANVNGCPNILMAQDRMLFSTLDGFGQRNKHQVLLDPYVLSSGEENQLFKKFSNGMTKCLLDQFMCSGGPCVRGRLSHGEIDYASEFSDSSMPQEMAVSNLLLCVLVALCHRFHDTHTDPTKDAELTTTHMLVPSKPVQKCCAWVDTYQSIFHPHAVLSKSMLSTAEALACLRTRWGSLAITVSHKETSSDHEDCKHGGGTQSVICFSIQDGENTFVHEDKSSRFQNLGGSELPSSGTTLHRPHLAAKFGCVLDEHLHSVRNSNDAEKMVLCPELPSFFTASICNGSVLANMHMVEAEKLSLLNFTIPDGPFIDGIPVAPCLQSLVVICTSILQDAIDTLDRLVVDVRDRKAQSSRRRFFVSTLLMVPIFERVVLLVLATIELHVYSSCKQKSAAGQDQEANGKVSIEGGLIGSTAASRLLRWLDSFAQCIVSTAGPPGAAGKSNNAPKRKNYDKAVEQASSFLYSKIAKQTFNFPSN
jgi:hypothetical protein